VSISNYSFTIQSAYARARELYARAHSLEEIAAVYQLVTALTDSEAGEAPELLDLFDRVSKKLQQAHARANNRGRGGASFFAERKRSGVPRSVAASRKRDPERTARKRRFAAMSILPPHVSESFTEGERAALFIIADDCRLKGYCDASAKEIADRAGVGITTVRNAYRQAKIRGLIDIEEREAEGRRGKHSPNIYRIACLLWKKWISSPVRQARKGVKIGSTIENQYNIQYDFLGKMALQKPDAIPKRRFR